MSIYNTLCKHWYMYTIASFLVIGHALCAGQAQPATPPMAPAAAPLTPQQIAALQQELATAQAALSLSQGSGQVQAQVPAPAPRPPAVAQPQVVPAQQPLPVPPRAQHRIGVVRAPPQAGTPGVAQAPKAAAAPVQKPAVPSSMAPAAESIRITNNTPIGINVRFETPVNTTAIEPIQGHNSRVIVRLAGTPLRYAFEGADTIMVTPDMIVHGEVLIRMPTPPAGPEEKIKSAVATVTPGATSATTPPVPDKKKQGA